MEGEGDEIKSKQASKRDRTLIIHFGLTLQNKCKIVIKHECYLPGTVRILRRLSLINNSISRRFLAR